MSPCYFLSIDEVLNIHHHLISAYGGDPGLRDRGLLEAAISMAQATFGNVHLHQHISDKAAAYHYHLCINHPFDDGNKRVAITTAKLFLLFNGLERTANEAGLEALTFGVAVGRLSQKEGTAFFALHTVAISQDQ